MEMEQEMKWLLRQYDRFFDWIVFTFQNPYNIDPQGYAPVQAEGKLPTGEFYYFRARHNSWSLEISKSENDWFNANRLYNYREEYGIPHQASYMPRREAIKFATREIKKYYETKNIK